MLRSGIQQWLSSRMAAMLRIVWLHQPRVSISRCGGRACPVHQDGEFVPRLILPLSLSYDHRVIDGADAVRFTRRLAGLLSDLRLLLL